MPPGAEKVPYPWYPDTRQAGLSGRQFWVKFHALLNAKLAISRNTLYFVVHVLIVEFLKVNFAFNQTGKISGSVGN